MKRSRDAQRLAAGGITIGPPGEEAALIKVDMFSGFAAAFFLSHMHADHLLGLTKGWSSKDHGGGKIYCTRQTKELLMMSEHAPEERSVVVIEYNEMKVIVLPGKEKRAGIMAVDANHCTGSAMFLIKYLNSTVLHTGDFRYCDEQIEAIRHELNADATNFRIFTDVTFLDPSFNSKHMPTAEESVKTMLAERKLKDPSEKKEILLLHSALGGEAVIKELYRQTGVPVLFPREKVLTERTRAQWDYIGKELGDAVCFKEAEWTKKGGTVRAVPFTMMRTADDRKKFRQRLAEVKGMPGWSKERKAKERRSIKDERIDEYHRWNVINKYQRVLDVENMKLYAGNMKLDAGNIKVDAGNMKLYAENMKLYAGNMKLDAGNIKVDAVNIKLEDMPMFFRLSTLAFCEYKEGGKFAWNGLYKCTTFNQTWEMLQAHGRDAVRTQGRLPIYRVLHFMHSPCSEIELLREKLGQPWFFNGLHGQGHTQFGAILEKSDVTYQECQAIATCAGGVFEDDAETTEKGKPRAAKRPGDVVCEVLHGVDGDDLDDWHDEEDFVAIQEAAVAGDRGAGAAGALGHGKLEEDSGGGKDEETRSQGGGMEEEDDDSAYSCDVFSQGAGFFPTPQRKKARGTAAHSPVAVHADAQMTGSGALGTACQGAWCSNTAAATLEPSSCGVEREVGTAASHAILEVDVREADEVEKVDHFDGKVEELQKVEGVDKVDEVERGFEVEGKVDEVEGNVDGGVVAKVGEAQATTSQLSAKPTQEVQHHNELERRAEKRKKRQAKVKRRVMGFSAFVSNYYP